LRRALGLPNARLLRRIIVLLLAGAGAVLGEREAARCCQRVVELFLVSLVERRIEQTSA